MRWSTERKVNLGFGSALAILIIIGGISYQSTTKLIKDERWVSHTHQVLEKLEDVLADTAFAEVAQRNYLLTGQELYLEPYYLELHEAEKALRELRRLTVDNPHQQQRLGVLESLVQTRFVRLQETIDIRRDQGFEAALRVIRVKQGGKIANEIRKVVHEMIRQERELLNQRNQNAEATAHNATLIISTGSVLGCIFVSLASLVIMRDITKRQQAEEALKQAHGELEIRVEERTAELKQINQQLRSEIAERQRAEEEVRLLQVMTQAISESQDFHSALGVALQQVCEATGWSYGEAWIPNGNGALQCSPAWYSTGFHRDNSQETASDTNLVSEEANLAEFRRVSEALTFPPATGLPGRVWLSGRPEWMQDVSSAPDSAFLRANVAKEVGFKAGLGIPIINHYSQAHPETLAVLVFFMFTSCEEERRLVELVATVATQLSSLIQRKRTEAALRESEERYRAVVEQTSEGLFLVDPDTKSILETNAAFQNLLGYTSGEILGLTLYDLVALDRETLDQNARYVLAEHSYFISEVQHRCKDGSLVDTEVSVNLIFYSGRKVFCVNVRDITERKRTEEALRLSQRAMAETINGVVVADANQPDNPIIYYNPAFERMTGYSRDQIIGHNCRFLQGPDTNPADRDKIRGAVLEKRQCQVILKNYRKDGTLFWNELTISPVRDTNGQVTHFIGVQSDITERKRAEEALQESQRTLATLFSNLPGMAHRSRNDRDWTMMFVSEGCLELTGYHPTDLIESSTISYEQIIHPGDLESVRHEIEEALRQRRPFQLVYRIVTATGEEKWVWEKGLGTVSPEGELVAIEGFITDITEIKRAEEGIRQALEKEKELSELKSRFVTTTSHEFRTPLTTIMSSTELLEHYSHKWGEEKKSLHLQRIQTAVKNMTRLLNDVLLIGKAEAGKLEFSPASLDLAEFCRNLVEEIQVSTSRSMNGCPAHSIAFCSQGQCTNAVMDEKLLRHILSNLLSNAIKYSPQGETVHFDLVCHQAEVTFQVRDEGIGIPAADQANLFDSFHRASNVGTISGTGLGLAIVKRSVDLHGGTITVQSQVGVGTTFKVMIPQNYQALTGGMYEDSQRNEAG